MTISRIASTAFLLTTLGVLFAGCGAALGPPPGSYPSEKPCSSNLNCNSVPLGDCTRNERYCYKGRCQLSKIPNCPPGVAPSLSPALEAAPEPMPATDAATPAPAPAGAPN